jgi:hypothetical protein
MNSKQLKLLVIIFVCIGVVGALLVVRSNKSWSQGEQAIGGKVMPDFPMNDITQISIQSQDEEATLVKVEETWRVADRSNYAADFSKIREILLAVGDAKILRKMQVGESQLGRLELLTPDKGDKSGLLLTFKGAEDKELGTLLLGKQSMRKSESSSFGGGEFPDGRYLLPDGDVSRIAFVSETFSNVETEAKAWLDKTFFKVEKLKSAEITHADPLQSWSVSRETETGDMVLAGLGEKEELDSSRSYSLKNILSSPSFNDIASSDSSDEDLGLDAPIKAALKTFDGFNYEIQIGKANDDEEYPVRIQVSAEINAERVPAEGEKEEDKEKLDTEHAERVKTLQEKLESEQKFQGHTFMVSKWTVDALTKPRSDYIKAIEEETEEGSDTSVNQPVLPDVNLDALTNPLNLETE